MKVTIINAGGNNDYIYGLISGLSMIPQLTVDVIDSDKSISLFNEFKNIRLLPFIENHGYEIKKWKKAKRLILYHIKLLLYSWKTDSVVFHIQWENKFKFFDRIILPLYYIFLGKKLVFTAHNVNAEERDGKSSWYNSITLRYMYQKMDCIIAHAEFIKRELMDKFEVPTSKIKVIMHGINIKGDSSDTPKLDERKKLNISPNAKVILFFGALHWYKGLDILIEAMPAIVSKIPNLILLIAGHKISNEKYVDKLMNQAQKLNLKENIILHAKWINDEEVATYFNAADCVVLPYRNIFQSGVPFMAYKYGLPVIATRVGGLPEIILEGKTGYICEAEPDSISKIILYYFKSSLYENHEESKTVIKKIANEIFSWEKIAKETYEVYKKITNNCEKC